MEVVGFCVRPLSLRSNADPITEPGLPPGGCSPYQSLIVPLASPPERRSRSRWQSARRYDSDHSQPNMLKSGSVSACAQGAPASSSLPQPREGVQRQPPPVKIRARRAARAAKSKVKASTPRELPKDRTTEHHVLLGRPRREYIATHVKAHKRNTGSSVSS